jgi:cellulose synthase/poly-beta-1,6-N-acetylglucosamine synthase-like glycosyltransferase/LysM repeat protein
MLQTILLYIPLSIIGIWRWSYWVVRQTGAYLYRRRARKIELTPASDVKLSLTVVTPVYNEDEALFKRAVDSWIANGVDEIIAVIDKSNTRHILNFEKLYVTRKDVKCRLVVTPKPGKRAALCDGIERSGGDLIALVDSDTVWNDNVRDLVLPYFVDPKMGGVTVSQRISNPDSISNVLFDILLWNRYHEEVPFLLGLGKAYNTLSGRTAVYRREALLDTKYDNIHQLMHEFFFNARAVSGDDKRLSHLILEQGWSVGFAQDAVVYTQGLDRLNIFLKQRLRWTRNSWRADLRAIKRGWVFKYPVLAYFMLDRFVQPFFMLLGPTAAVVGAVEGQWLFVGILVAWWVLSRTVRLFSYFRHYPKRSGYLPAYIIYSYVNALMKVYALATILENSWATRWHKSRLRRRLLRRGSTLAAGFAGVALVLLLVVSFVVRVNKQAAVTVPQPTPVIGNEFAVPQSLIANVPQVPKLPVGAVLPTGVKTYVTTPGDTLAGLAAQFNMNIVILKKLNGITDPDKINTGTTLIYYPTQPSAPGAAR